MADSPCPCPDCVRARRQRIEQKSADIAQEHAKARAESLLLSYLTPEQQADWAKRSAINVRGSLGSLFRVKVRGNYNYGSGVGVIRADGLGIHVWPVGLNLDGDWVLSMMLYLQADEENVVQSGCHWHNRDTLLINDYQGAI